MRTFKALVIIISGLLSNLTFSAPKKNTISVATLNIKLYGYDVKTGKTAPDIRHDSLKKYISKNLLKTDVITFQEIINKRDFVKNVLNHKYKCRSYSHEGRSHMHVMMCYKPQYRFVKADSDSNYIIEAASQGRWLRPAVHGYLTNKNGKKLAYIIAVHLKASPHETELKQKQFKEILNQMATEGSDVPAVVLGDFNSYNNDIKVFETLAQRKGIPIKHLDNINPYTFRNKNSKAKLDHIWVSPGLKHKGEIKTGKICDIKEQTTINRDDIKKYNGEISDHCYLKASLTLN